MLEISALTPKPLRKILCRHGILHDGIFFVDLLVTFTCKYDGLCWQSARGNLKFGTAIVSMVTRDTGMCPEIAIINPFVVVSEV